ncbi:toll-interacting protein B-like [Centruroides sculpturatus]|uniref:toll-interacting protein B-like n=1 Tax=Centruroides sculpturatus TaxID=218467 RepID=UPI000C6D69A8|nr:toll-interacting protein B-like [Centruroides sculpturatus]
MASSGVNAIDVQEKRKQVMVGDLPSDFLRISPTDQQQQLSADEQAAVALQHQISGGSFAPANVTGRLSVVISEAKLNKNYGVTRMDPYVRLRIGHTVYETHTDYNGAKNPRWNKMFHCFLFPGVKTFSVNIYDECAFSLDEKIAWGQYPIPESVFNGETVNEWFPLTGKQGEDKEGIINIILNYVPIPGTLVCPQPMVMVTTPTPVPYYSVVPNAMPYYSPVYPVAQYPNQPGVQAEVPVQILDEDIKQVHEMFPNIDKEVVKTVMESNRGNKNSTINALLMMNSES